MYIDVSGDQKNAYCPNESCILHPPDLHFVDFSNADDLRKEIESKTIQVDEKIKKVDGQLFIDFLYETRLTIIKGSLETRSISFRKWLTIDDLLIHLTSISTAGKSTDSSLFRAIIDEYEMIFQVKCFLEDIENRRYLMGDDKKPYTLRYWPALMQFLSNHGIVSGKEAVITHAFGYEEIDRQVREQIILEPGVDFGKYFQQMFDYIIALGYVFESQYITKLEHAYNPSGLDIAALLAMTLSCKSGLNKWSYKKLKKIYEQNSKGHESFLEFYDKYVSGKKYAPIIVSDGTNYLLDNFSPFFYSMYLIRCNSKLSHGQKSSGSHDISEKREASSKIFEQRIRLQLKQSGYEIQDKGISIREQGKEHEYDAIGVNEHTSEIVIVEAKYRDFSPSSISGKTLVTQELLGHDKLLDWVINTQRAVEFFQQNERKFKSLLNLQKELKQYAIRVFVVTKYVPLISSYGNIRVLDYFDFCSLFPIASKSQ